MIKWPRNPRQVCEWLPGKWRPVKWRPEKYELLHFIAAFWIEIYGLNNQEHHDVECLKLFKAIKVVEKVLKVFLRQ